MDTQGDDSDLKRLADAWERIAGSKFASADHEPDPMGRRLIEHGAICYWNCAQQLRKAIEAGDAAADFDLFTQRKGSTWAKCRRQNPRAAGMPFSPS